ncbi:MAG: hypothetical protein R2875_01105 [Desulfobacterales bacterium]
MVRERGRQDKRRVMVQVTKAGKTLLENAPPVMQESFLKKFNKIDPWEQTMILSALQRLVSMMDAKEISAAPFLSAASIPVETAEKGSAGRVGENIKSTKQGCGHIKTTARVFSHFQKRSRAVVDLI